MGGFKHVLRTRVRSRHPAMHQTHRWNSAVPSSWMTSGLHIMPSNMAALENGDGSD